MPIPAFALVDKPLVGGEDDGVSVEDEVEVGIGNAELGVATDCVDEESVVLNADGL